MIELSRDTVQARYKTKAVENKTEGLCFEKFYLEKYKRELENTFSSGDPYAQRFDKQNKRGNMTKLEEINIFEKKREKGQKKWTIMQ